MALSILLIDDEYITLKGLEAMLLQQKEVKLQITLAADAINALQILPSVCPDVVITDINMPEMDGLTMIEKIMEQKCDCKFIILSGYEKLEYYKKAIHLHIIDYILKPVDKSQLINRLIDIDLEKQKMFHLSLIKLKMLLFYREQSEYCQFSATEIAYLIPLPNTTLCIFIRNSSHNDTAVKDSLSVYFENVYYFTQCNQNIFLLNSAAHLSEQELRSVCQLCIPGHSIGLSTITCANHPAGLLNQEIQHLYPYALMNLVLSILPLANDTREKVKKQINQKPDTFNMACQVFLNETMLNDYIEALYRSNNKLIEIHLQAFIEILTCYLSIMEINLTEENIIQLYQQQVTKIINHSTLVTFMQDMLTNFWHSLPNQSEHTNYSEKINLTRIYIQQHYDEDLSLDQVAEIISLHPSYLSYIFKKEVGITFLQFLNKIRLEKACKLLKGQNSLSIEAIAAQAGYRSTTYFHKIFRSQLGMSPKQWQQQNK